MSLPLSPGLQRVLEIARAMIDHLSIRGERVEDLWITMSPRKSKLFLGSRTDSGTIVLDVEKRTRIESCTIDRPKQFRALARELLALRAAERPADALVTLRDVWALSIDRAVAVLGHSGAFDGASGRYDPLRIGSGPLSQIRGDEDWIRLAQLLGPRLANDSEMIVAASAEVQATMSAHERLALAALPDEIADPRLRALLENTLRDRVVIRRANDLAVVAELSKNSSCLLGVVDLAA